LFSREKHKFPALADGCEECLGIEIASFFSRHTGTHLVSVVALISQANFDGLLGIPHTRKIFVRSHTCILDFA
jgi:hypothetical protein